MTEKISWVDTHCHLDQLDLSPFNHQLELFFERASNVHVDYFLNVCIDHENVDAVCATAKAYPFVWGSIGIHPNTEMTAEITEDTLCQWTNREKIIAIGETGLDYYRSSGDLTWQQQRFRRHIRAAIATQKPLIVHSREANVDTIKILREEKAEKIGGILHCFAGDLEMAKAAIDMGFYISFSGIVTFKNATALQAIAQHISLQHLLVETDSPYLAPVPHRGKSNYPDFVHFVGEKIAELKQENIVTVAKMTTDNFFRLFPECQRVS